MILIDNVGLSELQHSAYVRFSVLAVSSIFFLVDPFAALPTFLAVTDGSSAGRRRRMAAKASVTAWVALSVFGLLGRYLFKMFGITLPAFEIAGGSSASTCGWRWDQDGGVLSVYGRVGVC